MALVPPAVVTVTSTVPTPAGEVVVIWVALSTVKEPAALLPNLTAVAPEKLVPVMVTAGAPRRRTGIWIDVGNGRRRHVDELIRCSDGAGTARRVNRSINATNPSSSGRADLGCAVDGERAGSVAADAYPRPFPTIRPPLHYPFPPP